MLDYKLVISDLSDLSQSLLDDEAYQAYRQFLISEEKNIINVI